MTTDKFDLDFDFDKVFGSNPEDLEEPAEFDDFDLDAALARELGEDFDAKFEEEFAKQTAMITEMPTRQLPATDGKGIRPRFLREHDEPAEPVTEEAAPVEEETPAEEPAVAEEAPAEAAPVEEAPKAETETAPATAPVIPEVDDEDLEAIFAAVNAAQAAAGIEDPEDMPQRPRRERRKREQEPDLKSIVGKIDLKGAVQKIDLKGLKDKVKLDHMKEAFAGVGSIFKENGSRFVAALKECKPGKMDKQQKRLFKNDVLPVLIGGAACLLCVVFMVGSLGRAFTADERQQAALEASSAQAELEAAAVAEIQNTLNTAAIQAAQYDYQGAIATLDSYKDDITGRKLTMEMLTAREQYVAAMNGLVAWEDPTIIPNLSFHVLIEDADRAYANRNYGSSYKKNFITTQQFSAILESLYANNYVLVTLDSVIDTVTDADGKTTYVAKPLYLPEGKTPIMITETLVNYFGYMVDGNGDGTPDAGGSGFAHKLVIQSGEVKAEYIDAAGNTQIGDYDLVPILDSFVKAHPDFSYHGAKAILAVTGSEGVFGWRTNEDESLVSGAKDVVEVLRATGYQIACNSYSNQDYGTTGLSAISAELEKWNQEVAPIVGEVDIMVIARGGSIAVPNDLTGSNSRFALICEKGYPFIIDASPVHNARLAEDFFYQGRLMVTGSELNSGIYAPYFTLESSD